nr:MAG TPA: hypothetical protein [Caudoviricetes sp.]
MKMKYSRTLTKNFNKTVRKKSRHQKKRLK